MPALELKVEGMVCDGCSQAVRNVVQAVAGVSDAAVDHEAGTANVAHTGGVDVDAVFDAIRDAGFDVRVVSET